MENNVFEDVALSWDSQISAENTFKPIPNGTYAFKVASFERGQYEPSAGAKMIACPTADLQLELYDGKGGRVGQLKQRLFLTKKLEWRLSSFFTAIGKKKEGEPLVPDWSSIIGAQGYCKIEKRKDKNGNLTDFSEVKSFLPPARGLEEF